MQFVVVYRVTQLMTLYDKKDTSAVIYRQIDGETDSRPVIYNGSNAVKTAETLKDCSSFAHQSHHGQQTGEICPEVNGTS